MIAAWLVLSIAGSVARADDVPTAASWIWYPESVATEGVGQTRYLRRTVTLDGTPREALIRVRADDSYAFSVNGAPPPKTNESGIAGDVYDLGGVLVEGENVLAFSVHNAAGTGGLIVTGRVVDADGQAHEIRSDTSFRTSREAVEGWDRPGFDDADWPGAGIVGSAYAQPWYRHAAFDMQPFLEEADRERWEAWRAPLLRLPEGIEDEPPTTARFDVVNGSCALLVDGEPRPPFIYRGTVDPLSSHGRRQVGLFRDAGVHFYTMYLPLEPMWKAPGDYDFSQLDDVVRGYLSVDSKARLFVILRLIPPRWWMDQHEDELIRYAAGDDYNTSDESGRVRRASLASKLWQQDALHIWRAAIDHLERQPWGKRVVGYQPGYGIYTEWHYFGSWREQMPDTGPAMTAHFREWLRGRYGTVDDLREAWLDTDVTFETATVPGVQPRLAAGRLDLRDPAAGQWVADYYRCQQEVTADDIELFCAAAKEATGGRAMAGVFYGYFYGVHPQTQGGHLELERLLASPSVDYFAAPYDYSHRLMGDDGRGRAICDAVHRFGRVWQTGSQQRSSRPFRRACELVRNGRLGRILKIEVGLPTGDASDVKLVVPVPENLDWNFWLGPAPWVPYRGVCHWSWRWIMDYSGGQLTDWAGHHIDIAHWGMGWDYTGPVEIQGQGNYPKNGLNNVPTEYKFTCRYASGLEMTVANNRQLQQGAKWYGERGWIHVNRGGLSAFPQAVLKEEIGPEEIRLYESNDHKQNFLDCVKTRQPTLCPVEIGHRSISVGLLGEIAMLTGRKIKWNPEREEIIGDPGASALLGRSYREPWIL